MSDTSTLTQYEITGNLGGDAFNFMLTDPALTDEAALAIAHALRTVELPVGMPRSVSCFKAVQNTVMTAANLADPEPIFA
ncbi:hypothetical protein V2S66_33060 [Streptomyces sp. V4-01]|uniref:Uncharacterized protein n=1 Tax=Actinacidiphila polyblastidii TaxID=3110430 RepID=A0ABU7PLS4_9ACTN|nr:hypothetical protein [Streptomyces sp. V4-01]